MLRSAALLGVGGLVACTGDSPTATGTADPATGPSAERPAGGNSATLMVYFSRAGENYWNGGRRVLEEGNTAVIAAMIADLTGVDTYRIEAADPYPTDYEQTVQRNTAELQRDARPAIATPPPPLANYQMILLGSPVWAVREPMVMRTFIDTVDLAGKTIHPFVTYAVSQLGNVVDNYRERCPGATVTDGLAIRGEQAQQSESEVLAWLTGLGLR